MPKQTRCNWSPLVLVCLIGCARDWAFLEDVREAGAPEPATTTDAEGPAAPTDASAGESSGGKQGFGGRSGSGGIALSFGGSTAAGAGGRAEPQRSPAGATLWARNVGGPANSDSPSDVVVDRAGNVFIVGSLGSTASFGCEEHLVAGSSDAFIAKYAPDGRCLWSKTFGAAAPGARVSPSAVATTKRGEVIMAGYFDNVATFGGAYLDPNSNWNLFLVKFTAEGQHVWSRQYGTRVNEWAWDMVLDDSDGIYIVGQYAGATNLGVGALPAYGGTDGTNDAFIAKFRDANDVAGGTPIWTRGYGSADNQTFLTIGLGQRGELIAGGYTKGAFAVDGIPLESAAGTDVLVTRHSPETGEAIWARAFGGPGDDRIQSATMLDTSVLLGGYFYSKIALDGTQLATASGNREGLLLELALDSGTAIWAEALVGVSDASRLPVAANTQGELAIFGCADRNITAFGTEVPAPDANVSNAFAVIVDPSRRAYVTQSYSGSTGCEAKALAWDTPQSLVMVGRFTDTLDIWDPPLKSGGGYDMFFGRLKL